MESNFEFLGDQLSEEKREMGSRVRFMYSSGEFAHMDLDARRSKSDLRQSSKFQGALTMPE